MTTNKYFNPMQKSASNDAINVLTVTRAFPIATQPWLLNHLSQIVRYGGNNRIVATESENGPIPSEILKKGLLDLIQAKGQNHNPYRDSHT